MCRLRRRCMLRNLILWCSSRQSTANRHWRLSSLIQSCRCLRHTENSLSDCQKLCCMYLPGIKCSWLRLGCLLLSYKLLLGTEHMSLRMNCPPLSYRLQQSTASRRKGHWQKRMCQWSRQHIQKRLMHLHMYLLYSSGRLLMQKRPKCRNQAHMLYTTKDPRCLRMYQQCTGHRHLRSVVHRNLVCIQGTQRLHWCSCMSLQDSNCTVPKGMTCLIAWLQSHIGLWDTHRKWLERLQAWQKQAHWPC